MIKWAMTASKSRNSLPPDMLKFCQQYHIPAIERQNKGTTYLLNAYGLDYLLVWENDSLNAYSAEGCLRFHPGMAAPRAKRWTKGVPETLATAFNLQSGQRVLDCTMGLANDALLASVMVGCAGSVICLEKSPVVYIVTRYGLAHSTNGSLQLQAAMRRIRPYLADYRTALPKIADNSVDVVYFDPMFTSLLSHSPGIANLRSVAEKGQPTEDDYAQARRIAKARVVVKHAKGDMAHIAFDEVIGGRYSSICYGIFYQ